MRRWQAALDKFAELYGRPYTHNYCGGGRGALGSALRDHGRYVFTQPPTFQTSNIIKVNVMTLTGKTFHLWAERPAATVEDFKDGVRPSEGIPAEEQRLVYAGRQLDDNRTLSDYGVFDGSTIHLILRLKGC
mmetsp:Transcript_7278/g.17728  ORF Transcript_7278/g.17728 Transcript_7278/m.17728 type:complete len:132 (-) Transcript_7278:534-929(-)